MKQVDVVMERTLGGKPLKRLVKDRHEYLQSYRARGKIDEYDLFGSGPVRHAAAWLYDRLSRPALDPTPTYLLQPDR